MPGTILVGVDGSAPSRSAIAWGVARAVATGSPLELLHVVERDGLADAPASGSLRAQGDALVRREHDYARGLDRRVDVTATLAEGRPEDVLARRSKGCALLVIGTHKTGFIYGRAFGSRFLSLGWRSRCDVAFIPDRIGYDRRHIVAGVDGSPTGDAVLLFAAGEAARTLEELVLVSSWGAAARGRGSDAAVSGRAAALSRAVLLAGGGRDHPRIRTRVVEHPTAEALVDASAAATLLVIGRRRPWGSDSSRAANHDVLLNMSSPVIVVLDDRGTKAPALSRG